ncbi:MAG: NHL repeat-containing protein [Acidobacteriota bacterium]|nr:NHL repeat-containing protein [Acidobacteriota bacterium]
MNRNHLLLLFTSVVLCSGQTPTFRVDRVAGIHPNPFDPVPAREAVLDIPYGITTDRAGNVYFHDRNNYVIRRVSTDGLVTVFAGNGQVGSTGDGGSATQARINYDIGSMTFGPDGSLYFADGWNCTVRRVTTAGIMERVAGIAGQCGFSGDGGPATSARVNILGTVSFDPSGNLYIGDGFNQRIRRVRPNGTIDTFAGTGTAGFSGDGGPADRAQLNLPGAQADKAGNVLILDALNFRIRRVNSEGTISTIAGNGSPGVTPDDGPALTSSIGFITYAATHPNGTVYFSDRATHKMYALSPEGNIRRVVGSGRLGYSGDGGPAATADVQDTDDLTVAPDGSVIFSDQLNHVIRRLTPAGSIETIAGRRRFDGNFGTAWEQLLNGPAAVAWDPDGGYYIYEQFGARIRRVDPDGTMITVAGTGEHGVAGDGGPARRARVGMSNGPAAAALAVDVQDHVYIADADSSRVRRFIPGDLMELVAGSGAPGFAGDNGPATEARLNGPSGIAIARDGRVFIADTRNNRIRVIDSNGIIRTFAGTGVAGFSGDGGAATLARLIGPTSLGLDGQNNLYFIDGGNRIRKISVDGVISTAVGSGVPGPGVDGPALEVQLANVQGLAVASDGTLIFAEVSGFLPSARLRYVGADQRVVSLNALTPGYQGDTGPVSQAAFSSIQQISINSWGDILVADRDNHVVRLLTRQSPGN